MQPRYFYTQTHIIVNLNAGRPAGQSACGPPVDSYYVITQAPTASDVIGQQHWRHSLMTLNTRDWTTPRMGRCCSTRAGKTQNIAVLTTVAAKSYKLLNMWNSMKQAAWPPGAADTVCLRPRARTQLHFVGLYSWTWQLIAHTRSAYQFWSF